MKIIGWLFFWLTSVAFGADALLSLEQQSLTLVRLGEVSSAMGGPQLLPQSVSAVPTILPLFLIGLLATMLAVSRNRRGMSRRRRLFTDSKLR